MSYQYSYAWEKFGRAIYSLATGQDEIRRRLLAVFQGDLLVITPEHLPGRTREDYQWIMDQLTKYDEKYLGEKKYFASNDGRYDHLISPKLEATLFRIRRATAAKVAAKLFYIWSVLDEEFRSS
jgi:hypothetical protein